MQLTNLVKIICYTFRHWLYGEKVNETVAVDFNTTLNKQVYKGKKDLKELFLENQAMKETPSNEKKTIKGWFPRRCAHLLTETTGNNGEVILKLFEPKQDSPSKQFNVSLKSHEHQPDNQNLLPFSHNEEEVTSKKKDE